MTKDSFKVCVLGGAGYVGLVTGVGLAAIGHHVRAADVNAERVSMLAEGRSPIHEPGIEELLKPLQDTGALEFTTDIESGIRDAEVVIVAVGSPTAEDGHADLSQAIGAMKQVARNLNSYKLIVVKSTLPVGMNDEIRDILNYASDGSKDYDLVFNPEFLREGKGVYDFFHPERIVVGGTSAKALEMVRRLYAALLSGDFAVPAGIPQRNSNGAGAYKEYLETDPVTAQMIKYASNAYLAARVSFVNELAGICERFDADVGTVVKGIALDSRIGSHYLQPGLGFGGPCLEKDIKCLIRVADKHDYRPIFFDGVLSRNEATMREAVGKIIAALDRPLHRTRIAIFGVAFKQGTNDARTSLSIRLMTRLLNHGATVIGSDPLVTAANLRQLEPRAELVRDPYAAALNADLVVIMNADAEYTALDLGRLAKSMARPLVYDTRYCLNRTALRHHNFKLIDG